MKKYLVIVAGGQGIRMKSKIPKQFLKINNKVILMHTIEKFFLFDKNIKIIIALAQKEWIFWQKLCDEYQFKIKHEIVKGGETRFHSVKNALEKVEKNTLVAVHDAVRPLVSEKIIQLCFNKAKQYDAVIPVIQLTDSIRQIRETKNIALNRSQYRIVQTPQVFKSNLLKKAYLENYNPAFTDDASLVEALGQEIFLVEGSKENIKITTQIDLIIAENLLK